MKMAVQISSETWVPTTKAHGIIFHRTVTYPNFVPFTGLRFKTLQIRVFPQGKYQVSRALPSEVDFESRKQRF
jgi:hypothetical protein